MHQVHFMVGDFQPPNLNGTKPNSKETPSFLYTPSESLGANVNSNCLTQMGAVL